VRVLDVLSHGAGICVALAAPGVLAGIWLAGDVGFHVLCAIAGIVEFLCTSLVVTPVRFFTRVRSGVELQVLQTGESALTRGNFALIRLLSSVASQVCGELVAGIKRL